MAQRFSAIDIGSNAMRMVVVEIEPFSATPKVLKKFRAPVRLGKDVFKTGAIQAKSLKQAQETFRQFSKINKKFQVEKCRAVATSACREAANRSEFQALLHQQSGIAIEIISGNEEAQLVHKAVQKTLHLKNHDTMLIDVGGGSVEVAFSEGHQLLATQSFPIGTVRMLEKLSARNLKETQINVLIGEFMPSLAQYIHQNTHAKHPEFAIGTGGNLEYMAKLKRELLQSPLKKNTQLHLNELELIIEKLKTLSVKERIEKLNMRPDRADVIVPACLLVHTIMRQAAVERLAIPHVGLRDGLILSMMDKTTS